MILGYLLNALLVAVEAGDYEQQTRIAQVLLPYEEAGLVNNSDIADIILSA